MDRTARMLKLIADSGKTKKDIAKEMCISPSRLSQLINHDEMKESQILAFCNAVRSEPSYLLKGESDPTIKAYMQLPLEYRELIQSHILKIRQILKLK